MDEKLIGAMMLMMCCICSSISSAVSTGGSREDDTGGGAGGGTPPDPEGNMIDGYTTTHLLDPGPIKANSISECRAIAKKHGYIGTAYRTSDHPNDAFKNSCFFYHAIDSSFNGSSESKDVGHKSGCTDPSKTWPNCGTLTNILPGYTPSGLSDPGPDEKSESLEKCRELAKSKGHKGVGFRGQYHPTDAFKNTCFYYTTTSGDFKGNPADGAHVTACTDATKTWPNC